MNKENNVKLKLEDLVEDIDEFNEKYVTYNTKVLRMILVKTLDYIKQKEKECDRLEQTLIEIKKIAKEDFNHTCWETYAGQLEQILQKISEVENE